MEDFIKFLVKMIIVSVMISVVVMFLLKLLDYDHTYSYYMPVVVSLLMILQKYGKK